MNPPDHTLFFMLIFWATFFNVQFLPKIIGARHIYSVSRSSSDSSFGSVAGTSPAAGTNELSRPTASNAFLTALWPSWVAPAALISALVEITDSRIKRSPWCRESKRWSPLWPDLVKCLLKDERWLKYIDFTKISICTQSSIFDQKFRFFYPKFRFFYPKFRFFTENFDQLIVPQNFVLGLI